MANFIDGFRKVILAEGGYVNDPDDAGGETYMGISRKANPKWRGWSIIDAIKRQNKNTKNLNKLLRENTDLNGLVERLYKNNYWDIIELDDIPNQEIANQLFDTCVNCGVTRAITIAQKVIGMTITGKWSNKLKYNLMKYGKED